MAFLYLTQPYKTYAGMGTGGKGSTAGVSGQNRALRRHPCQYRALVPETTVLRDILLHVYSRRFTRIYCTLSMIREGGTLRVIRGSMRAALITSILEVSQVRERTICPEKIRTPRAKVFLGALCVPGKSCETKLGICLVTRVLEL